MQRQNPTNAEKETQRKVFYPGLLLLPQASPELEILLLLIKCWDHRHALLLVALNSPLNRPTSCLTHHGQKSSKTWI